MPFKGDGKYIQKEVDPSANILNDSDTGTDHLGHGVYAEMLAKTIENVRPPVTIGIFARWGSGKSFLLNHVCYLLRRMQQQQDVTSRFREGFNKTKAKVCSAAFLLAILGCLAASLCAAFLPGKSQNQQQQQNQAAQACNNSAHNASTTVETGASFSRHQAAAIVALCLSVALALLAFFMLYCCQIKGGSTWSRVKLLAIAAFTKLPVCCEEKPILHGDDERVELALATPEENPSKPCVGGCPELAAPKPKDNGLAKRYIVVKFNAWAYARSENLWAGIATSISEAVESEFGTVTSRLFRLLDISTITQEPEERNSTACKRFFANLGDDRDGLLSEVLEQFGVVCALHAYPKWVELGRPKEPGEKVAQGSVRRRKGQADGKGWWVVEYRNKLESTAAFRYLEGQGKRVQYDDPCPPNTTQKTHQNGTAQNNRNDVELQEVNHQGKKPETQPKNTAQHPPTSPPTGNAPPSDRGDDDKKKYPGFRHLLNHYPKTACHVPVLALVVFGIVSCALIIVASVVTAATQAIKIAPYVLAPIAAAVPIIGTLVSFAWAMLHSQTSRITAALSSMKSSMADELGVMEKIKYEIQVISKLIQCTRFSHHKEYKIVLAIDDLDRVPLTKVKSVLEAVNILLSDPSSPFVCMIAVDPRVAVNCVEVEMGETLLQTNVNGHEYLKKIINLPFCLPDVGKKTQFISGLIDQADKIKTLVKNIIPEEPKEPIRRPSHVTSDARDAGVDTSDGPAQPASSSVGENPPKEDSGAAPPSAAENAGQRMMNSQYSGPQPKVTPPNGSLSSSTLPQQQRESIEILRVHRPTQIYGGDSPNVHICGGNFMQTVSGNAATSYVNQRHVSERGLSDQGGRTRSPADQRAPSKTVTNLLPLTPAMGRADGSGSVSINERSHDPPMPPPPALFGPGQHGGFDTTDAAAIASDSDDDPRPQRLPTPLPVRRASAAPAVPTSRPRDVRLTNVSHPIQRNNINLRLHTPGQQPTQPRDERQKEPVQTPLEDIGEVKFLYACKEFFHKDATIKSHLHSNPRNIKRIFNVLTLTAAMINCDHRMEKLRMYFRDESNRTDGSSSQSLTAGKRTKKLAEEITRWVVLTDQWPYRTSYILQVIEDTDQRIEAGRPAHAIENDESLHDIYEKRVKPELSKHGVDDRLLALDGDGDTFYSYLKKLGREHMSKQTAMSMSRYTINMDHSIRLTIAKKREMFDITHLGGERGEAEPQAEEYAEQSAPPTKDDIQLWLKENWHTVVKLMPEVATPPASPRRNEVLEYLKQQKRKASFQPQDDELATPEGFPMAAEGSPKHKRDPTNANYFGMEVKFETA